MAEHDLQQLLAKTGDPRTTHELLASALHEFRMRVEREKQARPGGLLEFVRYFWDTIEPGREFVEGWPLEAMAMHLEAVTYGAINRLLINVPPGSMKSLLLNVFWPAWEWSACGKPGMRYIAFSYSSLLTERDNQRMLDLIESQKFQDLWGHLFTMRQKGVTKISNNKFGWKFASSVRGTGTGERADRVLCFPEETLVATESGPIAIGRIVRERLNVRVWSRSPVTGRLELRPVTGWKHNPGSDLVRVNYTGGSVRCTPDHRFWVEGRGWIPADILGPTSGRVIIAGPDHFPFRKAKMLPGFPISDNRNRGDMDAKLGGKGRASFRERPVVNLQDEGVSEMRRAVPKPPILFAIRDILRPSSVFEIGKTAVRAAIVAVTNLLPFRNRPNECQHHELVDEDIMRLSISPQRNAGISLTERWVHEAPVSGDSVGGGGVPVPVSIDRGASLAGDGAGLTVDAPIVGNQVVREAAGFSPDFGAVLGVEGYGHVMETFCLTVEGNHNMFVSDGKKYILASNCDDPHNIKEGESQTIREETVRWFKEAMSNRLNHMTKSAIIVIMQRVHQDDVSGTIIDEELGYEHLMISMLYEQGVHCVTGLGWSDPRTEEGENFWPARFPPAAVEECLKLGEFAFAAQYQQRPSPRGGGIFKNEYWNVWEPEDGRYPPFDFILASVDPAYTHHDENDPSAMTVWGLNYADDGTPRVFLIAAWRKWLQLHGPDLVQEWGEPPELFLGRQKKVWGLVEWIGHTCKRFHVDRLLVEAKASGISVVQELQRLLFQEKFGIEFINPGRADKEVRANRVQHIWAAGMIYRPDRPWATMVEDEMAAFPKARYVDLTDSACYALWWFRQQNMLARREELRAANDPETGGNSSAFIDSVPLYPM
jgi:predicted phage terminase large subunit-like protein